MKILFSTLIIYILFIGCSQFKRVDPEPKISFKPPKYIEELPAKEEAINHSNDSLYSDKKGWFSDSKARRQNDIITVIIRENISATSSSNKKLTKQNATNLGGANIAYNGQGAGAMANEMAMANSYVNHSVVSNTNNAYTGQGSSSSNSNIQTTITARIIKVLQNNNYFISGRREILINGEKQIVQISGVAAKRDINSNNQIDSTLLADLKVMYNTQGDIRESTSQGWATKVAEALWPF